MVALSPAGVQNAHPHLVSSSHSVSNPHSHNTRNTMTLLLSKMANGLTTITAMKTTSRLTNTSQNQNHALHQTSNHAGNDDSQYASVKTSRNTMTTSTTIPM